MISTQKQISMITKFSLIFALIIILIVGTFTCITISVQKDAILKLLQSQMRDSCTAIIEKISILQATVDSREFDRKLEFALGVQRSDYLNNKGYHLAQFIIGNDDKNYQSFGELSRPPLTPAQIKDMLNKKNGLLNVAGNGSRYVLAYSYSFDQKKLIVLSVPEKDYLTPVYHLGTTILIWGVVALIAATIAARLLVGDIARSVGYIAEAAVLFDKGYIDVEVLHTDNTLELSALTRGFNSMIRSLNYFISELTVLITKLNHTSQELQAKATYVNQTAEDIVNDMNNATYP